jgi:hypothetical protein
MDTITHPNPLIIVNSVFFQMKEKIIKATDIPIKNITLSKSVISSSYGITFILSAFYFTVILGINPFIVSVVVCTLVESNSTPFLNFIVIPICGSVDILSTSPLFNPNFCSRLTQVQLSLGTTRTYPASLVSGGTVIRDDCPIALLL